MSVVAAPAPSPVRRITVLGLPLLLGALSASMSGVIDTAMMGRYGTADLAAVSGASAVFDVFSSIVLASVVGHQILAARFAGRDDPGGIRRSLRSSAWFCGGLAALLTLLCVAGGGWLTGLVSDGHADVRHIGAAYLAARGPTLLLLVAFSLLAAIFNSYERPRFATIAGVTVNVLNLVLDALLIYGPGPLPRLGAVGNGLATTLSWLAGVGCLLAAARSFGLRELLGRPSRAEPVDFSVSIPKLSWPAIVSSGLDYASIALFFAIVGSIGQAALGGGRIAFELIVLLFAIGNSFAVAGRILIGRSLGAGDIGDSCAFWRTSQRLLLAPALAVGAALVLFARSVALLFTSFAPVVDAAAMAMPLVGLCMPLMAWTLGNVSVLRALGRIRWDMYSNLIAALSIQLPVGWLLVNVAKLGIRGAYLAVVGYWLVRAALTEALARRSMTSEVQHAPA